MEPDFSEFSYGYALTDDLVRRYKHSLAAAPSFPSLLEEGKPGGGYDMSMRTAGELIFVQFKLSDYMVRSNAAEWRYFSQPYYRFHLRPLKSSQQHNLLLDLEKKHKNVFYVAPAFHEVSQLNNAFLCQRVAQESLFLKPSLIGLLPDQKDHYIAFSPNNPIALFCSKEPRSIRGGIWGEGFGKIRRSDSPKTALPLTNETMATVSNDLFMILAEHSLVDNEYQSRLREIPPIQQVMLLARTFFDCELLIRLS